MMSYKWGANDARGTGPWSSAISSLNHFAISILSLVYRIGLQSTPFIELLITVLNTAGMMSMIDRLFLSKLPSKYCCSCFLLQRPRQWRQVHVRPTSRAITRNNPKTVQNNITFPGRSETRCRDSGEVLPECIFSAPRRFLPSEGIGSGEKNRSRNEFCRAKCPICCLI